MASLRLSHKHVFDVDRVSSLIDVDQRHAVEFRTHSGSVANSGNRRKRVPDTISKITRLYALSKACRSKDKAFERELSLKKNFGALGHVKHQRQADFIARLSRFALPLISDTCLEHPGHLFLQMRQAKGGFVKTRMGFPAGPDSISSVLRRPKWHWSWISTSP